MPKKRDVILYQPKRNFSKWDSSVHRSGDQFTVLIDMLKRYRLLIAATGREGYFESDDAACEYLNEHLGGEYYNRNHIRHARQYLASVGVIENLDSGFRLAKGGKDIYGKIKKIPLN